MRNTLNIGVACVIGVMGVNGASVEASAQPDDTVFIEGCLTPGGRPGSFVLTDDLTGMDVVVEGNAELAAHARNHRARLTGRYVSGSEDDVFRVDRVDHVSDTCGPLYERFSERVQELVTDLRRKAAIGFRVGVAIDPEMMLLGAHAELATGVDNLIFRPNLELGFGEVTSEYAANLEIVYTLPVFRGSPGQLELWNVYIGGGPSVTAFNQEFRERDYNDIPGGELFSFDDWDSEVGLNVVVGVSRSNGFFAEVKAGAYGNPAIRLLTGFTF